MNQYMQHTKYLCYRCNIIDTPKFIDIKKHYLRKNPCKKKSDVILLSDDQLLVMSLIPHYNNNHNIDISEIEYLSKSSIIINPPSSCSSIYQIKSTTRSGNNNIGSSGIN